MKIETFGVIGSGEFGAVAATHLAPAESEVLVFDQRQNVDVPPVAQKVGFQVVTQADVILLAVPYDSYDTLLPQLANYMNPDSLVVDVCSVKIFPEKAFARHRLLDRENTLMTHPLFGPQSIENSNRRNLVVTNQTGALAEQLIEVWEDKDINILEMTAEQHDREMAKVHALTFFVGRALLEMGVEPSKLNTSYFSELLDLVDVERHHSWELFETIQRYNPFAAEMRQRLMAKLQDLDGRISNPA